MKIFTSSDIHAIDKATIEKEGIESIDLMERAASAVAYEIMSRWVTSQRILIFAGPGNNGGDALAVARLLINQGYKPEVILLNTKGNLSHDCEFNRNRLVEMDYPQFIEITKQFSLPEINSSDVVLDGLFGIGLSAALRGGYTMLAKEIYESGAFVISIDLPSGLFPEYNKDNILNNIVHANLTLTFQFPRLAFFFSENAPCLGTWKVLDIELNNEAIRKTPSSYYLIDGIGVREALRPRNLFADKNDFGRLYLVAGSLGMTGAAILSARAAMRAGVGVTYVHTPNCCYIPLQTAVPEAVVAQDNGNCFISEINPPKAVSTVAIGPGLGRKKETVDALETFLLKATNPVVLDADALNCISDRRSLLNNIPAGSVITPHVKEFDRLFGNFYSDEERFCHAIDMAKMLNIFIVLKGHYTMVFRPDGKVFINNTGNPGMATAGSGDVLTGIIAALMAQKYRPDLAATIGVYIHGYAGNLAARKHGEYGMTASDIIDHIGIAIKEIMEKR